MRNCHYKSKLKFGVTLEGGSGGGGGACSSWVSLPSAFRMYDITMTLFILG